MQFGHFSLMGYRTAGTPSHEILDDTVAQVKAAEAAGFEIAWFAEHHFSNYCICPSPLMMVARSAGETARIRLGSAVVVVPLYHPARLLAEIGMVDALSHGRFVLGLGSGYQPYELERFGETAGELVRNRTAPCGVGRLERPGPRIEGEEIRGQLEGPSLLVVGGRKGLGRDERHARVVGRPRPDRPDQRVVAVVTDLGEGAADEFARGEIGVVTQHALRGLAVGRDRVVRLQRQEADQQEAADQQKRDQVEAAHSL